MPPDVSFFKMLFFAADMRRLIKIRFSLLLIFMPPFAFHITMLPLYFCHAAALFFIFDDVCRRFFAIYMPPFSAAFPDAMITILPYQILLFRHEHIALIRHAARAIDDAHARHCHTTLMPCRDRHNRHER